MNDAREKLIATLARLGDELAGFGHTPETEAVIACAVTRNRWFDRRGIMRAVEAVRTQMLDRVKLDGWLAAYPALPAARPKNVGVIMAGNIPLVGFFDMLCVLAAGHACYWKPSSKDHPLMYCIAGLLQHIRPGIPIYMYIGQPLDAVIATGSDNTRRHFRDRYRGIPALLRGSRASAAMLTGDETRTEIDALARDIFSYCGLGCRNVSHLLLPRGCDLGELAGGLGRHALPDNKYRNNFRQRSAVLRMQGAEFADGIFFMLREDDGFPAAISEITYQFYDRPEEALGWLAAHDSEIQCVVGRNVPHPRAVGFGESQSPRLTDYPDGVDVMAFLSGI